MARFHVTLVAPWRAPHTVFDDVVGSLRWALQELGHDVTTSFDLGTPDRRHIVLCAHLLDGKTLAALPADSIVYNLEQIDPCSLLPCSRLDAFAPFAVWDYSQRNIGVWRHFGIAAQHCPLGAYPGLTRVERRSEAERDIDVLFFGAWNRRRLDAIERLRSAGVNVATVRNVFGAELDRMVARARLVLNLHCYGAHILETTRLNYLLANGIPVLAERQTDTEIPPGYEAAIAWSGLSELAENCRRLLDDLPARERLSDAGRALVASLDAGAPLAAALERDAGGARPANPKRGGAIPKIFHFVWIGDESKRPMQCIESWRQHHPEATIRIWGNAELDDIPWMNRDRMQRMAARELAGVADMMRWEILFREGGVAIDADSFCLRRLPDWLFECEMFAGWENELVRPGLISNGTVGSVAANPFLLHVIHDILGQPLDDQRLAWEATGPGALTRAHQAKKYANLTILPSHFFIPRHYTGCEYAGGGPVFAAQEWQSTQRLLKQAQQRP